MKRILKKPRALAVSTVLVMGALPVAVQGGAVDIVRSKCLSCHIDEGAQAGTPAQQWSRISHQRKTPEGWLMTIGRMQMMHGLQITAAERSAVVKYLADRQGLAPEEAQPYRYAMERRLDTMETFDDSQFEQMCARCHSGARVGLQRRPAAEWEHLVHFHLGQWPSTEYQALARDRDWLPIALNEMVPRLAQMFPLQSDSWQQWQAATKPALTGRWSFAVHQPGKGDGSGVMTVQGGDDDRYSLTIDGRWQDGSPIQTGGVALVYTGFEWRAEMMLDGVAMRQVLAADKEGSRMTGRWYQRHSDERGMEFSAVRLESKRPSIVAVYPPNLRAGERTELTIVGAGLEGDIQLGAGVKVEKVLSRNEHQLRVQVVASPQAPVSVRDVRVGAAAGAQFTVYNQVDQITVSPAFTIARVGGNGGSTPKVQARFEAVGWAAGDDGKTGTADDVRIGYLPARWHVEPFDEAARADNDVEFAGRMDARTGVFTPGAAGPNPLRRMSTNNAGNLKVVAEVENGGQSLQGDGQLIVTVQRWNNAPLP